MYLWISSDCSHAPHCCLQCVQRVTLAAGSGRFGLFQTAALTLLLQGVDYARRAANRRAIWGNYEEEQEQEEFTG